MSQTKNVRRVSLDIPLPLIEQIQNICKENLITVRKWFIDAANEKLEKENLNKIDKIVRR